MTKTEAMEVLKGCSKILNGLQVMGMSPAWGLQQLMTRLDFAELLATAILTLTESEK